MAKFVFDKVYAKKWARIGELSGHCPSPGQHILSPGESFFMAISTPKPYYFIVVTFPR
jgi:hypothetical protein